MKNHIQHIFFDLDHTLWDFEKNSALAFETVLKKHQIAVDLNDFLQHYIPLNLLYWEKYRKEEVTQAQLRYGRLKDTFNQLSFDIEDAMIDTLSAEYIHYLPQFNHLFEGAIEVLDYLKPNYQLHIITNGFEEVQSKKLKNSNIEHYFTTITNSEMAGVKKPNPLIFEYALNAAKADKSNSIMIGDCIDADVQGALDFGMDAILFNENKSYIANHIKQINHLIELKKYF